MQDVPFKPKLHLFICVNERTDRKDNTMPSCSPTITKEDVREVKLWLQQQGLTATVYCTKASCLGFCNPDGGVICLWPTGRFVKGIKNIEEIKKIVMEELNSLS